MSDMEIESSSLASAANHSSTAKKRKKSADSSEEESGDDDAAEEQEADNEDNENENESANDESSGDSGASADENEDEEGSAAETNENDNDNDDDGGSEFIAPIVPATDGRVVRFELSDVADHLLCKLCGGFLRDAYTLMECLHTFCRSCLETYVAEYWDDRGVRCPYAYEDIKTKDFKLLSAKANNTTANTPATIPPPPASLSSTSSSSSSSSSSLGGSASASSALRSHHPSGRSSSFFSTFSLLPAIDRCPTLLQSRDPLRTDARFDRALQNLVDKLLPVFIPHEDELKKGLFEQHRPNAMAASRNAKAAVDPYSAFGRRTRKNQNIVDDSFIIFELTPWTVPPSLLEKSRTEKAASVNDDDKSLAFDQPETLCLPTLSRPFIKTSVKVTVKHLRKYVCELLALKDPLLDILCMGEVMGSDHSVEFIRRTRWQTNETNEQRKHLILQYRKTPVAL